MAYKVFTLKGLFTPSSFMAILAHCFYTDGWGAYRRHVDPRHHVVGKRRTQQLERKQLTLRTRIKRLVRKTICFSKSVQMRETVIGLFINRFEFSVNV
jgi:insertion element IS1 protein InsB